MVSQEIQARQALTRWPSRGLPKKLGAALAGAIVLAACQQGSAEDGGRSLEVAQAAGQTPRPAASDSQAAIPSMLPSPLGHYLAARAAMQKRDMQNAARFFSRALAADPNSPDLLRRTFLAMLSNGDIAVAADLARRLAQRDNSNSTAALTLAVTALRAGDGKAALRDIDRMTDRGLSTIIVPIARAWVLQGQGQADEALKTLGKLKEAQGVEALHDLHAALILDAAGRPKDAEKHYLDLLAAQKKVSWRFAQLIGNYFQRTGRPERSAAVAKQYAEGNPESQLIEALAAPTSGALPARMVETPAQGVGEALFDLANLLHQERQTDVALLYVQLALYLRPQHHLAQMLLGEICEAQGRPAEAIKAYERIPADSPFRWSARLRIADALDELKRDDEAISLLEKMATEKPDRYDPLQRVGNLLRGREKFAEAAKFYDRAIDRVAKVENRHWSLLYARGIALERSKQWDRAEKDFLRALELEPEQPYVLNYLGYSWVEKGQNLDRAKRMIERAVEQRPNDGYIVDSLGWVLYRLGSFPEAVRHLERAVELRPADPVINDHLGDAYFQVGRRNEADFQWRRALANKPEPDLKKEIEEKIQTGVVPSRAVVQGGAAEPPKPKN